MPIDQARFEEYKRLKGKNTPQIDPARFEAYKATKSQIQEPVKESLPSEKFAAYAEPISQFGGVLAKTGPIGMGLAGAATMGAEIAKQGIQAYNSEPGTPTTTLESGKRIAGAFARGAAGEGLGRGVFAGAALVGKKLAPIAIKTGSQLMKVSAGIPEQVGKRILNDPSRLARALPVEEAGKIYGQALEKTGLEQGPEAAMNLMGKSALSQEGATNFAYDAIKKMGEGKLTYQEALVARDSLKNILNAPKFQNPNLAQNERFLIQMRDHLDNYLEPYFQEAGQSLAEARGIYGEAMDKKAFASWLPTNANKSASVLRGTLAAGAAGAGIGGYIDPQTAAAGMALASPRMLGYGIRAGASPITKESIKAGTRLGTQYISGQVFPSSNSEELRRKYMERR